MLLIILLCDLLQGVCPLPHIGKPMIMAKNHTLSKPASRQGQQDTCLLFKSGFPGWVKKILHWNRLMATVCRNAKQTIKYPLLLIE